MGRRGIKFKIKRYLNRIRIQNPLYRFKKTVYLVNKEEIKKLSENTNIPFNKIYWGYIWASYTVGCDFQEYAILELYKKSFKEKKKYVLTRKNGDLEIKYNYKATDKDMKPLSNKKKFNQDFKVLIKRKALISQDRQEILEFIENVGEIVIKPPESCGGKGIEILKKENIEDMDKFIDKIIKGNYLIEECVKQCKEMSELNPTSINTVRPFAIKNGNGNVKIIGCVLRIGKKGSKIDNISSGGIACAVDLNTGKVISDGIDRYGNKFKYTDTGKLIKGFQIPKWKEIKETVECAMNVKKNVRWASFDLCVKNDGIDIIEANDRPEALTYQLDGPKLQILKDEYRSKKQK